MPENHTIIKVLIVDDEKRACANLKSMLINYVDSSINVVGIARNTQDAEEQILKHSPDAVFLDVEMPHENAFEFLNRIIPFDFEVVFVTAYDEYAIKAFKLNAVDYILKPISINELENAVKKLKDRIRYKKVFVEENFYTEVSGQVNQQVRPNKIILRDSNNLITVDFKDILYIEAQRSYSQVVYLKNNILKETTLSGPLSDYEELLPIDMFYRVHRSYLINGAHVKKIVCNDAYFVIVNNNIQLPVSRRRYPLLREFLINNRYSYE